MMDQKWEGFRKPKFGPAPAGYIAGMGRGATGFITRSDIGPARIEQATRQNDDADYSESKYDSWSGYSAPLFNNKHVDQQDREAQQIYNSIENRIDGKRREQRERIIKSVLKKEEEKPSISDTFSDLKRDMVKVSYDQWLNLPESADSSLKKRKKDKYVPVPDTVLTGFMGESTSAKEVVDNINQLGEAKEILLKSRLDKASDNVKGQTMVDRTGYLTSLNSIRLNGEQYMGDLKRARLVLKSAITTTPQNPDVWMCAARVEELDGKLQQARDIINQGLVHCKNSEDLWIEASRLERPELSKALLVQGLAHLPASQKLWAISASKETDKSLKSKILKKGLQNNSTSLRLWKQLIQLQDSSQAKDLLKKAVECLPNEVELWLALAKLQTYDNSKAVLNKARRHNPLEVRIWIAAAQLQETQNQNPSAILQKIQNILSKANQVLIKNGIIMKRNQWLEEAITSELSGSSITCQAIVKLTYTLSSQAELQNIIAKKCIELSDRADCPETVRLLYRHGIICLSSKALMDSAIAFQRIKGDQDRLNSILRLAVQLFGTSEEFWIATADNCLKNHNYEQALAILEKGSMAVIDPEHIQLKKVDILLVQDRQKEAEQLLELLRKSPSTESWVKSIQLYYRRGNFAQAWDLCEKAYKTQISERILEWAFKIQKKLNGYTHARAIIQKAVERYEKSQNLWVHFANLEIEAGYFAKARAALEKARLKIPKSEELYLVSVELELKAKNQKSALFMLSKGLSECPKSGCLWTIAVEMEPRSTRLKKIAQAENACENSPQIFVAGAKIFWKESKIEKAKKWLQKGILLNPVNGDTWAYFYCFIRRFQPHNLENVVRKFKSTMVSQGRLWNSVSNLDDSYSLSKEQVLEKVVDKVEQEMNVLD